MVQQESFYKRIIDWKYLIINGYFDFQNKNTFTDKVSNFYGKDDVIDPESFNLNRLSDKNIYSYISNEEYVKYKDPFSDGKVITTRNNKNQDKEMYNKYKRNVKVEVPPTSPIVFTIPKNNYVRRKLKFPNLYSYFAVVSVLVNNRENIIATLISDDNSTSRFFNIKPYSYKKTKLIKEKLLNGYTHFYKTDFSSFYHTIYTHSIAWIINSKNIAKEARQPSLLGNLLDKTIECEQNGETHGVPTGNLVTRIIMEYCMAIIDKELRNELKKSEHKINFCRYVDDFTFAYNYEEDLTFIKKAIQTITDRYELNINIAKTKEITYSENNKDSLLLNYFDNQNFNKNTKINTIQEKLINYLTLANREELQDIKGTGKLIFTGLNFYLQRLIIKKEYQLVKKFLQALVFYKDPNEATIIDMLFEWVILDSKRGIYFIRLIDRLLSIEELINTNIINSYMRYALNQTDKLRELLLSIKFNITNNNNQEAYILLLLLNRFNIYLPYDFLCNILKLENEFDDTRLDDFTGILLLSRCFKVLNDPNKKSIPDKLLRILQNLLSQKLGPGIFTKEHWLIRYYVLFNDVYSPSFKRQVNSFYSKNKNLNRVMDFTKCKESSVAKIKKEKDSEKIDNFYYKLIEQKVKFNFAKTYKSNDI